MERMVIEYLANALWQLPVLALGAWLLLRIWKLGPVTQHCLWLAVLALGLLLPLRGAIPVAAVNIPAELPVTLTPGRVESGPVAALQQVASMSVDASARSENGLPILTVLPAYLHRIDVSASVALWIVGLWLAVALWGLLRIALAWRAARRLVANSREATLGERERAALLDCARRVGVAAPEIRESDAIAGPVIVGAVKPVLLWPENLARISEDEMRAALFHEFAHIRRRDYGMNLLCEMAALPLKWHPATHKVERRIRATREMACDAMAAEAMDSETIYAECLVRLARSIVGCEAAESSLAAGLLNGNVMEERIMRLMRGRTAMSLQAKVVRGAVGAGAMLAAVALATAFHVTPAMAQAADANTQPTAVSQVQAAPSAPATVPQQKSSATPAATTKANSHHKKRHSTKPVEIVNGQERDLTPAEQARIEKQLAEAQKKIAEATAKIDSPEFKRQIEEAQRKAFQAQTFLNSAEFQQKRADAQKQLDEMMAKMNSPEFRKKIQAEIDVVANGAKFQKAISDAQETALRAQAQKHLDEMMAKMNSPENRKKIQAEIDAAAKVNSEEFQKQIGDAQAAALRARTMLNSPDEWKREMADAQKQIAAATARVNSPEFKKQIEDAARAAAKVNSAEFQKQMADAQKQLADAMARMKAEQEKSAAK